MKLYLVGFMGCGKTTVGKALADRLRLPFFDLDELVEAAEKMSIKEIFAERGEPHFRMRERDILRSTRYLEKGVVATGGGTFTFEDNIQFIQSEGYSIHLSAAFPLLHSRIGEKAAERPMFRDDLATHELFRNRLRFYNAADLTIEVRDDQTVHELAERIVLELPRGVLSAVVSGAAH